MRFGEGERIRRGVAGALENRGVERLGRAARQGEPVGAERGHAVGIADGLFPRSDDLFEVNGVDDELGNAVAPFALDFAFGMTRDEFDVAAVEWCSGDGIGEVDSRTGLVHGGDGKMLARGDGGEIAFVGELGIVRPKDFVSGKAANLGPVLFGVDTPKRETGGRRLEAG